MEKCNNTLKWNDENGVTQSYPCVMEDIISGEGIRENKTISTFIGDIRVKVQLNADTNKLIENNRFLFDNSNPFSEDQVTAYKLTNIKNFVEGGILELYMSIDQKNEATDDFTNKIADAFKNVYTINVNQDDISQEVGFTSTLSATVKLNGEIITTGVDWISGNSGIATVDSGGNIELISTGSTSIKAQMSDNSSIFDEININVVASVIGIKKVRITPNTTSILEDNTETYNVLKYLDENVQADTFTIVTSGVPSENYILTIISGNNFSIENKLFYNLSNLTVTCTSNIDSEQGIISIQLKGLW